METPGLYKTYDLGPKFQVLYSDHDGSLIFRTEAPSKGKHKRYSVLFETTLGQFVDQVSFDWQTFLDELKTSDVELVAARKNKLEEDCAELDFGNGRVFKWFGIKKCLAQAEKDYARAKLPVKKSKRAKQRRK